MSDEQSAAIARLRKLSSGEPFRKAYREFRGSKVANLVYRRDAGVAVELYLAGHPEPPPRPVLEPGPNSYVGWKIVGQYPDGSLLVDGPTGERRHVWFIAQSESESHQ